jgi:hypothetical protein
VKIWRYFFGDDFRVFCDELNLILNESVELACGDRL